MTEICVPPVPNAGGKLSIGRWFKRTGDPVRLDEPLVELDSDQLTQEIRAPATGVLSLILAIDGQSVALSHLALSLARSRNIDLT